MTSFLLSFLSSVSVAQLFWVEILLFFEKSEVPGYKHFLTMALLSVAISSKLKSLSSTPPQKKLRLKKIRIARGGGASL
jgi:hypothetical protein